MGFMSGTERYLLQQKEITLRYGQPRTYTPAVVEADEGIELKGKAKVTINVPLEQLAQTNIPNDAQTISDLTKWAIGAGLIGYGINQAGNSTGSRNTTINNNAAP